MLLLSVSTLELHNMHIEANKAAHICRLICFCHADERELLYKPTPPESNSTSSSAAKAGHHLVSFCFFTVCCILLALFLSFEALSEASCLTLSNGVTGELVYRAPVALSAYMQIWIRRQESR